MSSETSTCPEDLNSTDCLLRAVIQALKEKPDQEPAEFEWDPLNFTFAVILGVLAALIAVPALYHAVYNTEKRRKVNHRAIGEWSQIKERTWVGSDMSFQYTAKTPVYRMDDFQKWIDTQDVPLAQPKETSRLPQLPSLMRESEWIDTQDVPLAQPKETSRLPQLPSLMRESGWFFVSPPLKQAVPAAGWVTFSKKTGLNGWIGPKHIKKLRSVSVEHLPDDIVAAPAYAEVGVVLVAAAAAGIGRANFDKKFENAFVAGDWFQLDFLRHPLLGLIGTFTHYDVVAGQGRNTTRGGLEAPTQDKPRAPTEDEFQAAKEHAGQGRNTTRDGLEAPTQDKPRAPTKHEFQAAKEHALGHLWLRKDSKSAPMLVDITSEPEMNRIRTLYEEKLPTIVARSPMDLYSHFFMKYDLVQPYVKRIHHFFQASTPKYIPAFFPRSLAGFYSLDDSLDTLALNGKYWSAANVTKFAQSPIPQWPKIVVGSNSYKWTEKKSNEDRSEVEKKDHPLPSWRRFKWGEKVETLENLSKSLGSITDVSQEIDGERKVEDVGDIQKSLSSGESDNHEAIKTPKAVCGFPAVLHMCMKLLNKPSDIKNWFFGSDFETMRLLRRLVFRQLKHVDAWLETDERVDFHTSLLFRTWLLLLTTRDKFNKASKTENIDTTAGSQLPESVQEGPDKDTMYGRHSKMILWLRELLGPPLLMNPAIDIPDTNRLLEISRKKVLSSLLSHSTGWEKIAVIHTLTMVAAYHSDKEEENKTPHLRDAMQYFEERRELEDVLIYRFLLLVLLYHTAADNSSALNSGLWDRIIPII